jgi:GTPase SAR1 family protein
MADKKKKATTVSIPDKPFVLDMPPVETGGCSILMIGSGRSGKTTALKYIIDRYFQKHVGAIFSESAKAEAYAPLPSSMGFTTPTSCAAPKSTPPTGRS